MQNGSQEANQPSPLRPQTLKRCEDAVTTAFRLFPEMLAACHPEDAASITADLIKAVINRPSPQNGPDGDTEHQEVLERLDQIRQQRLELAKIEAIRTAGGNNHQLPTDPEEFTNGECNVAQPRHPEPVEGLSGDQTEEVML